MDLAEILKKTKTKSERVTTIRSLLVLPQKTGLTSMLKEVVLKTINPLMKSHNPSCDIEETKKQQQTHNKAITN